MLGPLGYGRYDDRHIGCPRAKSDMTPCVARDGRLATDDGECVGCNRNAADLFRDLVRFVTRPEDTE